MAWLKVDRKANSVHGLSRSTIPIEDTAKSAKCARARFQRQDAAAAGLWKDCNLIDNAYRHSGSRRSAGAPAAHTCTLNGLNVRVCYTLLGKNVQQFVLYSQLLVRPYRCYFCLWFLSQFCTDGQFSCR